MNDRPTTTIRRLIILLHRDFGFFFSGLILVYCVSGLALNHVDDWNPDFVIQRIKIEIPDKYTKGDLSQAEVVELSRMVGETDYKLYDSPSPRQLKIYYDNASLLIDLPRRTGIYEKITRRPVFYQTNILHRNNLKGWKWASDFLAVMLIVINLTGLLILKGDKGLSGRGKWLVLAGMVPPLGAWILYELLQR